MGEKQIVLELTKRTRSECIPGGSLEGAANLRADPVPTRGLGVHAICVLGVHRPLGSHDFHEPGNELGWRRAIGMGEGVRRPCLVSE